MPERESACKYTRAMLTEAVSASTSVMGVLRYLGIPPVGGFHSHISRRIKKMDLDTSHFVKYPGNRGLPRRRGPDQILVLDRTRPTRTKPEILRRSLTEIGRPYVCALCERAMWAGEPLTLEIDHINTDWCDNRPENLRYLCPNCHAQTPSYRGRSKYSKTLRKN